MKHILVEYKDGSLQWFENTSEKDVNALKEFKRIKSFTSGAFYFSKKRWKESNESQFKITFFEDSLV